MCKVIWSKRAIAQYGGSVRWYGKQGGVSLANNFEQHIGSCLSILARNPYMARQVEGKPKLREYVVQKYPFIISYYVENDNINIASFLHQSRDK
ncbi:MAG: type II toxin-antitoxin system RelE/ParE family toxin [Alphaproteobacteria bacterium]|jgi:plasmid stabilization system protein ParE|nr:type II toxin-antitoxin system RelE/ParE family toxin [Alphaproteobacteria bacterium]